MYTCLCVSSSAHCHGGLTEIRGHSRFEMVVCQLAPEHATMLGFHVGARNMNSDLHTALTSSLLKESISQVCLGFVCLFV